MQFRSVWRVGVVLLLAGTLFTPPATARENPIRPPRTAWTPEQLQRAKASATFVCGTYKGNQHGILWKSYQYKHRLKQLRKRGGLLAAGDFVSDDVLVMEDDGTVLIQGVNRFDTDTQTFHFVPNANGGYDVSTIEFKFDASLGSNLALGDDTNATRNLPFTFTYYGTDWTTIHINANGIVSFGGIVNPSGFFDPDDFFNERPKIAPYFMDLNPAAGGGVFLKIVSNKVTITWNQVPEFETSNSNTIQLVIYEDNTFDITFNGIDAVTQINDLPTAFGIHPGGVEPTLDIISFSDDLPYVGGVGAGFYEHYLDIKDPIVNDVAMMNRFYQSFADSFFQVVFFTNFTQTMSGAANEVNIKNTIEGIGLGTFDFSDAYGSNGVLESRCNMNQLSYWPSNPEQRFFSNGNNFLTILAQETGHRWGAFVNFLDENGHPSNLILGRADAHWSYFADTDHSSLEGGNWEHVSGDLFRTPTRIDFFGDIDEYIFGARRPEEVTPTFYVSSPNNDRPNQRERGTPVQGATARGTAVEVTIEDIIAAEGARLPAEPDAPKDLRQAFLLITKNGTSPTEAELDKIARFRRAWEDYFERAVDGRLTLNTSLTRVFPVAVVEGHVTDATTGQPLLDITVKSVERRFEQFVPNGGRYTFRYLADENSGTAESVTIIADAPGYVADTVSVDIDYGTEITLDFALQPNPTAVADFPVEVPRVFELQQNYPNPFNPETTIRYRLPETARVELVIFNSVGQRIRTLVRKMQRAGAYAVRWDGRNEAGEAVASGVYLVRFTAGSVVQSRKMVLVR